MGFVSIAETQKALLRARDSLGCSLGSLRHNDSARAGDLTILRKGAPGRIRMNVATPAQDRGMILGMSLLAGHRRRIREGAKRSERIFDRNSVYIREFDVDYAAEAEGVFDFLLIELPADSALRLKPTADSVDHGLGALVQGMLGWLSAPHLHAPLMGQEFGARLMEHLAAAHALLRPPRPRARLSPVQLARAKAMLMSDDVERLHLDDVAAALDMPRNTFFRSFRETAGMSPYQWLLGQRLDHARLLLRQSKMSLVDVALACGFADQSHFTRMFQRAHGASPGRWRRGLA
ncbi:helix-turn-helix transcriptional regulator [Paracoccus laeviglucosivorans]|uniref:Transcriptional regulator, AraC family n=1 Tax=Paracoccus laeviglucosivorans TaxID=1197861 RepID=A0A521D0M7_9RHOB|nr:AraC family transcriptional regulator [Paracoccus laeviglucosivorans]SMO64450.1 transcriptional regulator, AraC family [Paracoccus laeviglucosivorans]